jgi:hypothetical protein
MSSGLIAIAVALIGGPLMWLLARLDKRNSRQHAASLAVLEGTQRLVEQIDSKVDGIEKKVDVLDSRIYGHLEWHNGDRDRPTS